MVVVKLFDSTPCMCEFLFSQTLQNNNVFHINLSTGRVLQKVPLPVALVQTLSFGGPHLDILFVTTTSYPFDIMTGGTADDPVTPLNGLLYQIKGLGVRGVPANRLPLRFATCALKHNS